MVITLLGNMSKETQYNEMLTLLTDSIAQSKIDP